MEEIRTILRENPLYPGRMRELASMPERLYNLGELPDDGIPSVAIVGAKLCSSYGRGTAYQFGMALAKCGVQIISGMAAGIDASAQAGALDGGGKSFAVLAGGVDICYPRGNIDLYGRLIRNGGILSEQPPGTKNIGYLFPTRNRIISALSDIVLVVEAKAQSGSLITVDFALSQGKTVFAVPGRVGDLLSDGCNYLIAQGAGIAYSPEAVLHELKIMHDTISFAKSRSRIARFRRSVEKRILSNAAFTEEEKRVFRALSWEDAYTPDQIAAAASVELPTVRAALTHLLREKLIHEPARDSYQKGRPQGLIVPSS